MLVWNVFVRSRITMEYETSLNEMSGNLAMLTLVGVTFATRRRMETKFVSLIRKPTFISKKSY